MTIWIRKVPAGHDGRTTSDEMLVRMAGDPRARVVRTPIGRPYLHGGTDAPHVSISHHQRYVATAMTTLGPIGVDVETLRELPVEAMATRWFAPDEARWLAGLPSSDRDVAFLRLWTLKEAAGKALGVGLRGGGMRRPVGPLPVLASDPLLAALPHVPGIAAITGRYGDLIVAVACQALDAVGVRVEFVIDDPG